MGFKTGMFKYFNELDEDCSGFLEPDEITSKSKLLGIKICVHPDHIILKSPLMQSIIDFTNDQNLKYIYIHSFGSFIIKTSF